MSYHPLPGFCSIKVELSFGAFPSKILRSAPESGTNFALSEWLCTVQPRFNKVPRDWGNWFVKTRVRYIEVLFHTLHYYWAENIVRYTEDLVI